MNLINRAVRLWRYKQKYEQEVAWVVSKELKLIPLWCGGTRNEVKFNPKMPYTIWDNEEWFNGFYHLHPPGVGMPKPSATDVKTMFAWERSLGADLFCWIDNGWAVQPWLMVSRHEDVIPHNGGTVYSTFDTMELRI